MDHPDAKVSRRVKPADGGYEVTLQSDCFVRGLYLSVEGELLHLSDNFFDLLPGEPRTVSVRTMLPQEEFESRLGTLSLADTY